MNNDKIVARRYRNRRIGEFLKELDLTEGRCTGIPTIRAAMTDNGSPPARFSTDEARTYFLVELPVHPQSTGVQAHDKGHEAHDGGHDEGLIETELRIFAYLESTPRSQIEMAEMLGMKSKRSGHLNKAMERLRKLGLAELTIPDKLQSKNQKLRITENGQAWLARRSKKRHLIIALDQDPYFNFISICGRPDHYPLPTGVQ